MHRVRPGLVMIAALSAALGAAEAAWAQITFTEQGAALYGGADYNSRSASLADFDRDGDLDILFQGAGQLGPGQNPTALSGRQFLRNNFVGSGVLSFTNITSSSNVTSSVGDSWSAAWGDYNGDGYVDLFVGQTNSGSTGDALRNNGGVNFTNSSNAIGLNDPGFHQNVGWVDIDGDLDLDLVIGMEGPEMHEIYLQAANGTFNPVGAAAGIQVPWGTKSYGLAIGDTDGDGDLDMYVSTCRSGGNILNNFFENQLAQTGVLSFVDIANSNGTQNLDNSYHSEFADFDDDGDLDLLMVGADQKETRIFRNDGGNQFTDVATLLGHDLLSDTAGDLNGGRAIDYDNDGDLDLYMHDNLSVGGLNPSNQARKLYRNDGDWKFVDVTAEVGLASTNMGAYDSTWGDLDRDGDLDLVAPTRGSSTSTPISEKIFISNASTTPNHWLFLRLEGTTENTTAIGASVYATIFEGTEEERTLRREANTSIGTFNQSDLPVHFGLGLATVIDELRIVWPDGSTQFLYDVAANQYLTVGYPGDLNGDRVVDAADLATWASGFGASGAGDVDGDGDTDGADFLAWQRAAGMGAASTVVADAVAEPTGVAILLAGVVGLAGAARKRR